MDNDENHTCIKWELSTEMTLSGLMWLSSKLSIWMDNDENHACIKWVLSTKMNLSGLMWR
jgi:hypothetical protein